MTIKNQTISIIKSVFEFTKANIPVLGVLIAYILLHNLAENIITKGVVKPILSQIESNIINDFLFITGFIYILFRCFLYIKKKYIISSKYILISCALATFLLYYRAMNLPWEFTSFYLVPSFKYIDILIIFFVSNIFIRGCCRQKKYKYDKNLGFNFDNPIKISSKDILRRGKKAKQIAEKIKNTANAETSFAIGINGEWGQGKTSFVNLISDALNDENRVIVNFNPWLNNDEKSIIHCFFDELGLKLRKYNKELSNDLIKYASLLNTVGTGTATNFSDIFSIIHKNEIIDLKGRFEKINQAIKASGLQFVIFIDDLDRLYENEILEVLRLIRNTASFSNTVFIASYDRNYLVSALKRVNDYHPDFYLEKIFQIEFSLPAFDKKVIKDKLLELIIPHIKEEDRSKFEELLSESFLYVDESSVENFEKTYFNFGILINLRDVSRFSNSFIINYQPLAGEIDLRDLLYLELLRIKYLGVYNMLSSGYNKYLDSYTYHATKRYLTLRKVKDEKDRDTDKSIIEEYLQLNYQNAGIQPNQIQDVIKYLYRIFPHHNHFSHIKTNLTSISNPTSVNRYFHYSLLESDLSEIEFSKSRQKSQKEFKSKIKEWVDKGLGSEVAEKLKQIDFFDNKDDFEKVIECIFYFANLPNDRSQFFRREFIDFDQYNLYYKIYNKKVVKLYKSEQDYKQFVEHTLESQESPYIFISKFLNTIIDSSDYEEWSFIVDKEKIKKYKLQYFQSYSSKIAEFDKYTFWLYNYCKYQERTPKGVGSGHYESVSKQQDQANTIFIDCALRIPHSFIKNIIALPKYPPDEERPKQYSLLYMVTSVWGSWENFEYFVNDLSEGDVKGLTEFKDFYQKLKENGYQCIDYNFKEIDISDALLFSN